MLEENEVYKSNLFENMWEVRDNEGWMIGCGQTKELALLDTKTYDKVDKVSYNMKLSGF